MTLTPLSFAPESLTRALAQTVAAFPFSQPSHFDATGVHHGYCQIGLVRAGHVQPAAKPWLPVLDEFEPVWEAWISWINPGGFVIPHRDAGPWRERWQIPIIAGGVLSNDDDDVHPVNGQPFQVRHWVRHSVANDSDRPRVHLVLDRDVALDVVAEGFKTFPPTPRIARLIERLT